MILLYTSIFIQILAQAITNKSKQNILDEKNDLFGIF